MKTIITDFLAGLLVGILIGLLLGGLFWSTEYLQLYKKYYQTREVLELIK
jgi:hypothetical protein